MREKLHAASVPHSSNSILSPKGKMSAQHSSSPMTAQRLLALVLLLVCVTLGMLTSLLYMASRHEPIKMMGMLHSLPEHISSYSLIIGGSIIAAIGITIAAVFIGLALSIVNMLICPKKSEHFVPLTPFALDLPAEEVAFSPLYSDHLVRGLYIAREEATTTILVSPGYRRTLTDVLGMCKHLWVAGHNVLVFEYYGHGSIVGVPITLGYREVNDFLGAVTYARQRAPLARIGALGYSMGGSVTIMGSAQTPEVLAVVSDSAFASHKNVVEMAVRQTLHLAPHTFRRAMSILSQITDTILAWRAGYHFHQVEPSREIARLSPRPVLLIHGLADTVVHPDDSVQLYEAAGRPKALWHLPGTEHTKGYFTDSATYTTRILTFFDRYLKQSIPTPTEYKKEPTVEMKAREESADSALPEAKPAVPYFWQRSSPTRHPASYHSHLPTCQATIPEKSASGMQQAVIEQSLMQIVAQTLSIPPEQIRGAGNFFEYGGDSHSLDVLLSEIERRWHVHIEANDVFDHPALFHLAAFIMQRQGQSKQEGIYV